AISPRPFVAARGNTRLDSTPRAVAARRPRTRTRMSPTLAALVRPRKRSASGATLCGGAAAAATAYGNVAGASPLLHLDVAAEASRPAAVSPRGAAACSSVAVVPARSTLLVQSGVGSGAAQRPRLYARLLVEADSLYQVIKNETRLVGVAASGALHEEALERLETLRSALRALAPAAAS